MTISAAVKEAYTAGDQAQVFRFEDQLDAAQAAALGAQLAALPPPSDVKTAFDLAQALLKSGGGDGEVSPFGASGRVGASADDDAAWYGAGLDAVRAGRVGVMVLAGGQCVRPVLASEWRMRAGPIFRRAGAARFGRVRARTGTPEIVAPGPEPKIAPRPRGTNSAHRHRRPR